MIIWSIDPNWIIKKGAGAIRVSLLCWGWCWEKGLQPNPAIADAGWSTAEFSVQTALVVWKNNPPKNYGKFFGFVTRLMSTRESQLYTFFSSIPEFEDYSLWNYFISDEFLKKRQIQKYWFSKSHFQWDVLISVALGFKSYERSSPLLRTVAVSGRENLVQILLH